MRWNEMSSQPCVTKNEKLIRERNLVLLDVLALETGSGQSEIVTESPVQPW